MRGYSKERNTIHKDHHAMKEVVRNFEYKDRIYGLETFLMNNNQY